MKKSQGKERERKKQEGVGGADGMRVYIFHSSPPEHGLISTSFNCCGTIQTGKAEPLSLSVSLFYYSSFTGR